MVVGDQGAGRRAIATYDGYLQFTVAQASGLIALQVLDPAVAPVPETITASFQGDEIVDIVIRSPRSAHLDGHFGGDPIPLYHDPRPAKEGQAVAFVWSPDGNQLAWLIEVDAGTGCDTETAIYEWRLWTGSDIVDGPRVRNRTTFACNYVPFFDQFEQSVPFWSPDSTMIDYAGTDVTTGEPRGVDRSDRPVVPPLRLIEGELGVWSPDVAGPPRPRRCRQSPGCVRSPGAKAGLHAEHGRSASTTVVVARCGPRRPGSSAPAARPLAG